METIDIAFSIAALSLPPAFIFLIPSKLRGFVYAVLTFWGLTVVGSQYHLAYTPDYNSMAPGISIVAGWIPGIAYTTIWLAIASQLTINAESKAADERSKQTSTKSN